MGPVPERAVGPVIARHRLEQVVRGAKKCFTKSSSGAHAVLTSKGYARAMDREQKVAVMAVGTILSSAVVLIAVMLLG